MPSLKTNLANVLLRWPWMVADSGLGLYVVSQINFPPGLVGLTTSQRKVELAPTDNSNTNNTFFFHPVSGNHNLNTQTWS